MDIPSGLVIAVGSLAVAIVGHAISSFFRTPNQSFDAMTASLRDVKNELSEDVEKLRTDHTLLALKVERLDSTVSRLDGSVSTLTNAAQSLTGAMSDLRIEIAKSRGSNGRRNPR